MILRNKYESYYSANFIGVRLFASRFYLFSLYFSLTDINGLAYFQGSSHIYTLTLTEAEDYVNGFILYLVCTTK